ncbi:MAG: hypothetical protein FWH01_13485, partial [Oscillospiraceae bacterium]|nr:hypothetical protein [Oscillospiraceae bacterium]
PYLTEGVTGYLQCKVASFVENHTHTIFIADVTDAANLSKDPPMTYAYYHNVVRGKTAKNAPTYVADDEGGAAGATVAVGAVGGAAGATRAAGAANAAGATGVVGGTTGTTGTAVAAGAAGASGTLGAAGEVVFKCGFCGYEYRDIDLPFSELPDTFYCPICRAAKENFALTAINKSART